MYNLQRLLNNIKLLHIYFLSTETIQKFRLLKKSAQVVLMISLEKAIWNWMDTYPHEFAEIQVTFYKLSQTACVGMF